MEGNRPFYKSVTLWIATTLLVSSVGFYYLIGGDQAHEIINAVMCAVTFAVAIGFSATVCKTILKQPWEYAAEDAMILGVFTLSASLCVVFIGLWGYRLSENDVWWKTNVIFFTARVFAGAGFVMMMTAVHAVNGELPRGAYIKTGWVVGGAILFALLMISLGYS